MCAPPIEDCVNHFEWKEFVRDIIRDELNLKVEPTTDAKHCDSVKVQMMLGDEEIGDPVIIEGHLWASHGNWANPDDFAFRVK